MRKLHKKGFTIVELVIVIAVIAILAAVLIPTFANIVKKSQLSSDEVAVKNMNTILAAEGVSAGRPKDAAALKKILMANGFAEKLQAVTAGHKYFWDSDENVIILVDCTNDARTIMYPEGYTWDATARPGRYVPLDGIPTAEVKKIESKTEIIANDLLGGTGTHPVTIDTGLIFTCMDDAESLAENNYADYYADFVVTFSKPLTYDETVADGKVGFMLIGKYTYYINDIAGPTFDWIPLPATASTGIREGSVQIIRTMKDMMNHPMKYSAVCNEVKEFQCAIKAVYDNRYSDTFTEFNDQEMDALDAEYLNGLEVTVELCVFKPSDDDSDEYGDLVAVVNTYKCRYTVTGSGTNEDPWVLTCEEVK